MYAALISISNTHLAQSLTHARGLLRGAIRTNVLFFPASRHFLPVTAFLRRSLSLPLAVELPGREGSRVVLGRVTPSVTPSVQVSSSHCSHDRHLQGMSMNTDSMQSSFPPTVYYWSACGPYSDNGTGTFRGPAAGFMLLQITCGFEMLVGAPSNIWLICHILRQRSKVAGILPADFFPLHLALTQMIFYLNMPALFANYFLWQNYRVQNMVSILSSTTIVMKPLLLCLVCVERYLAVVRPLHYQRFKAPQYRWGSVGVSWCIYITMTSWTISGGSVVTLAMVYIPVLVINTFCSLSILKTLKKPPPGDTGVMKSRGVKVEDGGAKQSRMNEGGSEEEGKKVGKSKPRGKGVMNSMKKKAFITIVIIQAVLTLSYLPMIITAPMRFPARTMLCQYVAMALAAAQSCSYLQPLLYLHRLGRLPCMLSQNT
ncbi:hypothetical protein EYF80_004598 [Liparis tanakae]|uniref:G-protein coupled receptors family 1 profile domain-containing protein n=1 Tax=Liparis tanakae TaxID=230148 RepID=A0A4Z2J6G9_9TELE|nr:hypothetical protein EYF80_004598 [Liparis tanakae]